jgi:hypothetical protein
MFRVVILAVVALLYGCQRGTEPVSRNSMTTLSPRLQPLFEKIRPVCFGRFLIQVPATADVVYGPAEAETPIQYFEGEGDKVAEHLAARLAEVETERQFLLKDDISRLPLFGKVIGGARAGQKIVFGSKNQAGYTVHSFVPIGKDLYVQYVNSIPPDEEIVSVINAVATKLQARPEGKIPAEPGSCIEGGFVPLTQEYERVTVGIRMKEFPDVHLSIDVHKNLERLRLGNSPKLLREQAKESAEANGLGAVFARTRILRQQERQLGAWKGEESAFRTPAFKDDKSVHEFRFHSLGAVHDPLLPELDIRFDSGVNGNSKASINSSITDEEALALWDKLITTIRVRQPSDATPVSTTTPKVPLASSARTGDVCPQTGWWEGIGYKATDGGSRRLLKVGEPMPPGVVIGKFGLWQRLVGDRTRQAATVWKLVAYEDEPAPNAMGEGPDEQAGHASAPGKG